MPAAFTAFDKFTASIAPRWTLERVRTRLAIETMARHYEAAQPGRRTSSWHRTSGDANAVVGAAGAELRRHARDLLRNNAYARRGRATIVNSTVGWGIVPKAKGLEGERAKVVTDAWKNWADGTQCDVEGRRTFAGIQRAAMRSIYESGEALIRRRWRRPTDNLPLPFQLQLLEPDYLDSLKNGDGAAGGKIIQGIEFDAIGRRVAYWIFSEHPGNQSTSAKPSQRVPATEFAHVYDPERIGSVRGVSWLAASIVDLKELDEFDGAELMKQKIAAMFAGFVSDADGMGGRIGDVDPADPTNDDLDMIQPGLLTNLAPGKQITFANPPALTHDSLPTRTLRRIAVGIGLTYEDLTGDYSQVNFSSARMGRIAFQGNVRTWQWDILIPLLCAPVWAWAMEAAAVAGLLPVGDIPGADWTAPPLPMIEPDKEGLAVQRLVRGGIMTPSEMVREQGGDPDAHWAEYEADLKMLEDRGIKLDSLTRDVSQAGLTQARAGIGDGAPHATTPAEQKPAPAAVRAEPMLDIDLDIDVKEFDS